MSATQTPLAIVQDLYVLQIQLQDFLDKDLRKQDDIKEARKCLRNFSSLLEKADPRVMGGDDILEALQDIREKMALKIKDASKVQKGKKK